MKTSSSVKTSEGKRKIAHFLDEWNSPARVCSIYVTVLLSTTCL
jgi:hypothetical protein